MDQRAHEDFRCFVVDRSPALLRTAYVLTGQRADAEDLLQTTLAKSLLAWDRVRDPGARDAYVRRVMLNSYLSSWRRRRRLEEVPTEVLPERSSGRDAGADLAVRDVLWTAVVALPRRQRAMVVLRYYEGLSEAETAQALGVCAGTVKSSTSRALRSLRASVGDDADAAAPPGSGRTGTVSEVARSSPAPCGSA